MMQHLSSARTPSGGSASNRAKAGSEADNTDGMQNFAPLGTSVAVDRWVLRWLDDFPTIRCLNNGFCALETRLACVKFKASTGETAMFALQGYYFVYIKMVTNAQKKNV